MDNRYCEQAAWKRAGKNVWMLDKLMLSIALGYRAGPAGVDVPEPGNYVVRPCVNALGMGLGMSVKHIKKSTDDLPVGTFWCEIFKGRHLSVDYMDGIQTLAVEGFAAYPHNGQQRWASWQTVTDKVPLPDLLQGIDGPLNVEYIGDKVIEAHFRHNPDFRFGNRIAIPVYDEFPANCTPENAKVFVTDRDQNRIGFFVDARD